MSAKKRALGRGLDALLGSDPAPSPASPAPAEPGRTVISLALAQLEANPYQPRRHFSDQGLEELAASIAQNGILQPLVVRKTARAGHYELVAGERRWRAAQRLGLQAVPAIIRDFSDQEMLELALIENLQREELNAVEEARAYRQLMDEFGLAQEEVADRVGKSRTAVSNAVRLLRLPASVLGWVEEGSLSAGHARALLTLTSEPLQTALAREIMSKGLTVRDAERRVKSLERPATRPRMADRAVDAETTDLAERLTLHLGLPVKIHRRTNAAGRIEVYYESLDEFSRVFDQLGISLEQEI